MGHLKEVGLGYFTYMGKALRITLLMVKASLQLGLHAFLPNLYVTSGTNTLARLFQDIPKKGHRILLRFNNKRDEDAEKRSWRVVVDAEGFDVVSITAHSHGAFTPSIA